MPPSAFGCASRSRPCPISPAFARWPTGTTVASAGIWAIRLFAFSRSLEIVVALVICSTSVLQWISRTPFCSSSPIERGAEFFGLLNRLRRTAESPGKRCEIRIAELGRRNALGIFTLLVHADGAVEAVVDDDDEQIGTVLDRRRNLLAVHQEVAVARDADHRPVLEADRACNRCGKAVSHRARRRRKLRRHAAVAPVAVPPAREIAGAVADDRVRPGVFPASRRRRGRGRARRRRVPWVQTIRAIPDALSRRTKSGRGRDRSTRRPSPRTRPCPSKSASRHGRRGRARWGRGGRAPTSGRDGRA